MREGVDAGGAGAGPTQGQRVPAGWPPPSRAHDLGQVAARPGPSRGRPSRAHDPGQVTSTSWSRDPAGPTAWPSRAAGAAAWSRDPAGRHRVAESVKNLLLCPRRAWSALGNAEALLTT